MNVHIEYGADVVQLPPIDGVFIRPDAILVERRALDHGLIDHGELLGERPRRDLNEVQVGRNLALMCVSIID